jgi:recombination associated protein RdgC
MAFTKQGAMWVWLDPQAKLLVLDTGAQGRADEVVTLLVESLQGFGVALLDTQTSPQAAMAHWLISQEPPVGFSVDRECELKAADESKAVVRYARHPLDIDEVKQHVEQGKLPTKLAMTWDDRVSFVLSDTLQVKKIAFLDSVLDEAGDEGGFDTDVAIATGELSRLIPDLIDALGGEGRTELGQDLPAALQPSGSGTETLAVRVAGGRPAGQGGKVTGPAEAPVDTDPQSVLRGGAGPQRRLQNGASRWLRSKKRSDSAVGCASTTRLRPLRLASYMAASAAARASHGLGCWSWAV